LSAQKWICSKLRRLVSIVIAIGLLTGMLVVGQIVAGTPALAASCGTVGPPPTGVLLAGSAWLQGIGTGGVNVYSNGSDAATGSNCGGTDDYVNGVDAGGEWQCVELVNRLYLTQGWITAHWHGNGDTLADASNLPKGLTAQPEGSITSIVPGDVVTLSDSTTGTVNDDGGHAAVISAVTPKQNDPGYYTVSIVNQNQSATTYAGSATWDPGTGTLSSEYSGYSTQDVIHAAANTATDSSSSSTGSTTPSGNLLQNADFGLGNDGDWSPYQGGNFAVYVGDTQGSGPNYATYSGTAYAETNSPTSGGGFNQDVAYNIAAGDTFCATAMVRTADGGSGASGTLTIEQMSGVGANDGAESVGFGPLTNQWQQIYDCSVATQSDPWLRVIFQPTQDTPNLDVDDVDVQESLLVNADFGLGKDAAWNAYQGGNLAVYVGGTQGVGPDYATYSGTAYAETNSPVAGGGFNQDIAVSSTAGNTYCATAMVRTADGGAGAEGSLTLEYLNATGGVVGLEGVNFGPLTNQWQQIYDCSVAIASGDYLRVLFQPTPDTPNLDVDDVDVQESLLVNADFGEGAGYWNAYQGGGFAVYTGNEWGSGPNYATYSGAAYAEAYSPVAGGGFNQDILLNITAGQTFCLTAMVRTADGNTGASGTLTIEQLSGAGGNNGAESVGFGPLTNQWQQIYDCSVAPQSADYVRVIFLPTPNGPSLNVDDVMLS
jgi:CHAP domain